MEILQERLQFLSLVLLDGVAYFLIAMIGAFAKDTYDTISGTRLKIGIKRITVASLLGTVLTFAARSYMSDDTLIAVTFILGVIGWELFSHISTIKGLKKTIMSFIKIYRGITTAISKIEDEKKEE